MPQVIYKYALAIPRDDVGTTVLMLPKGAQILSVQTQRDLHHFEQRC